MSWSQPIARLLHLQVDQLKKIGLLLIFPSGQARLDLLALVELHLIAMYCTYRI
jgi:hypothetical protein